MGYRRMDTQDLWEIYRRWIAGQTVSRMATAEQRDRKTVREYIAAMKSVGLKPEDEPISRENRLGEQPRRQIIRIELPPGLETQLDYGKVEPVQYFV